MNAEHMEKCDMNIYKNKYKKYDWRYWYDSPQAHSVKEIHRIQSLSRRYLPYNNAYNIDLIGAIFKMYNYIYYGYKKRAYEIYINIPSKVKINLPSFLDRYF